MINPTEFKVKDMKGIERTYILHDIPYLSGGREIGSQFMSTAAPKIGDYKANENLSRLIFKHVCAIDDNGNLIPLTTDALVNNHVPDFVVGAKIEEAMLEKVMGFSVTGKIQEFQQKWKQDTPEFLTKIATQLLQLLRSKD